MLRLVDVVLPSSQKQGTPRLAVLFSGGLDCSILARLCHDVLPLSEPIDLVNVAFENPRVVAAAKARAPDQSSPSLHFYGRCPDRMTGLSTYAELLRICPGRRWNFVAVDVPYCETEAHMQQIVSLMYPHNTEMDLSISLALYFASRGRGTVVDSGSAALYTSTAPILLSGLGADELFGGYARHEIAYSRGGQEALVGELELDFNRIGKRNLGRDDRVISHWGKEVRYPYLDEDLVSWTLQRPVWEKCGFVTPGKQDGACANDDIDRSGKLLLRLLAWSLGMTGVAREKKRAIQFGARTAKMLTGKKRGTQTIS